MKTKRFWITPIVVMFVASILGGCFEDNYEPITSVCPMVISTDPADLDTEVSLNQIVTATFNEQMNPETITPASFILVEGGTTLAGALSYNGNNATLSFEPTNSLRVSTSYTATIKSTVKDLLGNALQEDYVWTFSTGALPESPEAIDLKTVARFGIIAGLGVSNNAGNSEIHDLDVGIYPGTRSSVTGFPPAIVVNGAIYASDDISPPGVAAMLLDAKDDLTEAYLAAEGATDPAPATVAGDQGGKTLAPGIYKSTSTLLIQNGDLTLDAQGDENAVWIFQIASDFTTVGTGPFPSPSGGNVILTGGARADNIIWQVGSSATIGDYTSFKGNILVLETITMGAYSQADGRMLARNGSVTMTSTNIINKP